MNSSSGSILLVATSLFRQSSDQSQDERSATYRTCALLWRDRNCARLAFASTRNCCSSFAQGGQVKSPNRSGFVGHWQSCESTEGSAYTNRHRHPTGQDQEQIQVKECFWRQYFWWFVFWVCWPFLKRDSVSRREVSFCKVTDPLASVQSFSRWTHTSEYESFALLWAANEEEQGAARKEVRANSLGNSKQGVRGPQGPDLLQASPNQRRHFPPPQREGLRVLSSMSASETLLPLARLLPGSERA